MKYPLLELNKEYLSIQEEIDKEIKNVLLHSKFILDDETWLFEEQFAEFTGSKFCVGVGSGTAALFLSLKALGISEGDEVITTPHTFAATAEAIVHAGANPVFVDIDKNTYNIDVSKIEEKISPRTKAILAVHLYGQPCNLNALNKLCSKYKLHLIEDCAQAHGALYKNQHVGTFGIAGCFSFYPGKNLGAYGDGGAVITNDEDFYLKVKMLRNHGRTLKYEHDLIGYCERLDNIQASVLSIKLKKLKNWNEKRSKIAQLYSIYLDKRSLEIPLVEDGSLSSYYVYTIKVNKEIRDKLAAKLKQEGIATGIYYPIPLHLQKSFSYLGYTKNDFPLAEDICQSIISLPINPFLDETDIIFISRKVNTIIANYSIY